MNSTAWQTEAMLSEGIVELSGPGYRAVIERSAPLPDTPDLEGKLEAFSASTGLAMADLLARANPPRSSEAEPAARGGFVTATLP
jgi:hypothetical protein